MDQISGLDSSNNLEEYLNSAQYNQLRSSGEIIIISTFYSTQYKVLMNPTKLTKTQVRINLVTALRIHHQIFVVHKYFSTLKRHFV